MNILNPLFSRLSVAPLKEGSVGVEMTQMPDKPKKLPTNLKPSWLYDSVQAMFEAVGGTTTTFEVKDKVLNKQSIFAKMAEGECIDEIHFALPEGGGTWDSMVKDLKGRWGTGDFYNGFWRRVKDSVLDQYGFEKQDYGKPRYAADAGQQRPNVLWAWRDGSKSARDDTNMDPIKSIFAKHGIDVNFLVNEEDFVWAKNDKKKQRKANNALLDKIQRADVMIGL